MTGCSDSAGNIHFRSAGLKYARGNYQGAIADCNKAIRLQKARKGNRLIDDAYFDRGISKFYLKDYQGAIADYTKVISITPKSSLSYHNRGASKQELNQHESAIKDFDKAIELEKDDSILYHYYNNRAWSKYYIGKLKEGLIDDGKSIELNQEYMNSFHTRGLIKHGLGDMKGACSDMKKSLSLGSEESKEWFKGKDRSWCLNM